MNINKPKEDFSRYLLIGLIFTTIILIAMGVYTVFESPRLAKAAEVSKGEAIKEGRIIYIDQCATCHGSQGEGGVGLPLNSKKMLESTQDDVLMSIVRSGVPMTQMPAWGVAYGGALTDQDVRNVVTFIRSWEPNAPVIEPETFTPSAERALLLFNTTCATCHGIDGLEGMDGEARQDQKVMMAMDDETFRASIVNGLPANGMPGYNGVLTAEQMDDLSSLMDAWRNGQTVVAPYKITDEVNAAIFALSQNDAKSATLRVQNALSVASGVSEQKLSDIAGQLERDNSANAQALLVSFIEQYPLGDPTNGQTLYGEKCSPCHGKSGEGGLGVKLNPNQFVQDHTNAELLDFILAGRQGTAMPAWKGRLTENEIADIIAFLRTWNP